MARAVRVKASVLASDPYTDRDLVMPDVNVSGGLLSRGHPLGATGIANIYEVSTHLRGEADKRQVEGARLGMTHVIGLGSACAIHILEKVA
jgi:acetyl-CoA acyltransferase